MEVKNNKYRSFNQIVNLIYNEALENQNDTQEKRELLEKQIHIEPKLIYDSIEDKYTLELL